MNSYRAVWGVRFGSSGAAALLVLAGASLNGSGRLGWATAFAAGAGLLAGGARRVFPRRRAFLPAARLPFVFPRVLAPLPPPPAAVNRQANGAAGLLSSVEAGKTFSGEGNGVLKELFNYLPDDLHLVGAIAAPMPIGDRLGGFVLLGSRAAMFTEDDRRLATTLTLRAGAQL